MSHGALAAPLMTHRLSRWQLGLQEAASGRSVTNVRVVRVRTRKDPRETRCRLRLMMHNPPRGPLCVRVVCLFGAGWIEWLADLASESMRTRELRVLDEFVLQLAADAYDRGESTKTMLDLGPCRGAAARFATQLRDHPRDHPRDRPDIKCTSTFEARAARQDGFVVRTEESDIPWSRGREASLPFETGRFDFCVAFYALHHLPRTRAWLAELRRLLRAPHGRLMIVEAFPEEASERLLGCLVFGAHSVAHGQPFRSHLGRSRPMWRALLGEAGFELISEVELAPSSVVPYPRVAFLAGPLPLGAECSVTSEQHK